MCEREQVYECICVWEWVNANLECKVLWVVVGLERYYINVSHYIYNKKLKPKTKSCTEYGRMPLEENQWSRRSSTSVPSGKQLIDTLIKHMSSGLTESAPMLTCSHLTVSRAVVAVLEQAETSCLPASSSGCTHPARFFRCAAQFLLLQLQTCRVKGQSPPHKAQVVRQPQSDANQCSSFL